MSGNTQIHLCADPKDLNCPICYFTFGKEYQPISTNCGHTLCSTCFDKVTKCPLCNVIIDKTQKYQKSFLLSSLLENRTKAPTCKEHSNICQGICYQEKVFVCLDCVVKSHQGHKIGTMKDLTQKTEKITKAIEKVREKDKMRLDLKKLLEASNGNQKRKLDEIIDQEIFQLSMLKKKLYKEIDIQTISDKEQQEHILLAENLSKYCQNAEKMLQDWDKNQEAGLGIQIMENLPEESPETHQFEDEINSFKTTVLAKQEQFVNDLTKNIGLISYSSAKVKELFPHKKQTGPSLNLSQIELEYLVDIFRQCFFIVSLNNNVLKLKNDETRISPSKFDSSYFTCSLSKISLNFSDFLSVSRLKTICQILESVMGLKDLTIQLQNIDIIEMLAFLEFAHLLPNLKSLEKFQVETDTNEWNGPFFASNFIKRLINVKNLSSLDIRYKEPQTIISAQFASKASEGLQEISLSIGKIPSVIYETLQTLKTAQVKSLKIFRLLFGKTDCNHQVLAAISEALRLQNNLQELNFTCKDLNDSTEMDFSVLLMGSTSCEQNTSILISSNS